MDVKFVNIDTQDGLVVGIQDSNWNDIDNPPAHVIEVASAVSKATDGWTQLSVLEDTDHVPYALAFVPMETVGAVSEEIYLVIECYANYENVPVMMHLKITPSGLPEPLVLMDYTILPVNGSFIEVQDNINRLVRHYSALRDMREAMTASIGNEEIVFFNGDNRERIKVYAKKNTPQVVIYQDDPKQDIIDKVAEVFKGRTTYVGDDVTVQFD